MIEAHYLQTYIDGKILDRKQKIITYFVISC